MNSESKPVVSRGVRRGDFMLFAALRKNGVL